MSLRPSVALRYVLWQLGSNKLHFLRRQPVRRFEPQLPNIKMRYKCMDFFFPFLLLPAVDGRAEASAFSADLIRFPCNAFRKPQEERKVNWRSAFGTSTLVFSDVSEARSPAAGHLNSSASERGAHYKHSVHRGATSPNYASGGGPRQSAELAGGEAAGCCARPSKKTRIDRGSFPGYGGAPRGALDPP